MSLPNRGLEVSRSNKQINKFRQTVWKHFEVHGRTFPWRQTTHPYKIIVSEIMLQQTQTSRVGIKYREFLRKFPSFSALAKASLRDVLHEWKGLGYNRRAKHLHQLAKIIVEQYRGRLPKDRDQLLKLPGIGSYTASAVRAFAYNLPDVVIETNVRAAYIKHFFPQAIKVSDSEIVHFIQRVGDSGRPREWNTALMDYGAYLKTKDRTLGRTSALYSKQSSFKGSFRELRAKVLDLVVKHRSISIGVIKRTIPKGAFDVNDILFSLLKDGLIERRKKVLVVTGSVRNS